MKKKKWAKRLLRPWKKGDCLGRDASPRRPGAIRCAAGLGAHSAERYPYLNSYEKGTAGRSARVTARPNLARCVRRAAPAWRS
jgi:hypothetical protein